MTPQTTILFLSLSFLLLTTAAPVPPLPSRKPSSKNPPAGPLTHLLFPPEHQHCTGGSAHEQFSLLSSVPIVCDKTNRAKTLKASRWSCRMSEGLGAPFLSVRHARVHCEMTNGFLDEALCTLNYHLDFSLLTVFSLGFAATVLCGALLALTMYLAVLRMMAGYNELSGATDERFLTKGMYYPREEERQPLCQVVEPIGASKPVAIPVPDEEAEDGFCAEKPLGYGSFGRKVEVFGNFSGSFSSLLEMSPMPSPLPSPPSSPSSSSPSPDEEDGVEESEEDTAVRLRREHSERVALLETELYMG